MTENPEMPIAFVHLTFRAEDDPAWPYTVGYNSWEEFQKSWNTPDG
ncbi:MAG: hypothetical protein ACKVP0_14025 [Pirellulaceae bacterium]